MSPLSWSNLRPLDGSQQSAFEELCCELAALEPATDGAIFVRKAPPDGGVECYRRMPDATEHGWQAKFFTDPPGVTQWQQIDKSVKQALDKHPQLTRYTLCIPRDREDPRRPNEEWFMDKWNDRVTKWQGWATDRGMAVAFDYWGTSEILVRLGREEHRGRTLFWFNSNLFTASWFRERLNVTLANAGPRYSPELRVDLPISDVFGGFCRTATFVSRLLKGRGKFSREAAPTTVDHPLIRDRARALALSYDRVLAMLADVDRNPPQRIPFDEVQSAASHIRSEAWNLVHELRESSGTPEAPGVSAERDRSVLDRVARAADEIADLATSDAALASNARLLIVRGDAGKGKTHLLCDIADARVRSGGPSVVLLGEQFSAGEPWKQIISLLGLTCATDEFLGALDAAAESRGECALIAIDALNESTHRPMWLGHLAGMVAELERYPRVRLVVSVRSSYEDAVIPSHVAASATFRITHEGFAGHEYIATKTFFRHYGIALPSVPLLNPEFENPLFLKLFCEGLHNAGLTEVPKGLHGVTTVFGFFIDATNTKLAREDQLGLDASDHLVRRAVDRIADLMTDSDVRALPRSDAKAAVDAIHTASQFDRTLFRRLIVEGVLAEDRAWSANGPVEVIRFAYERLADHLIAERLLDRHVDATDPPAAFRVEAPLGKQLRSETFRWNTGLLTALAEQLPERYALELFEVVPDLAATDAMRGAVVESVVWRAPTAFSDSTHQYIRAELLPRRDAREGFLNAMLTVAATPEHPYNADRLHALLVRFPMPERDRWWSTYLFRHAGEQGAVDRLVDWSRAGHEFHHIEDRAVRLAATALVWFLSTSHRPLRDDATKGAVALLTPRIPVLRDVLAAFREVDDLYIRERLYAIAYGCAMRTVDLDGAAGLAQQVYDEVFRDTPPVHILLRDYARGVVELALARDASLDVEPARIRPPYGAAWPTMPTKDDTDAYGERPEGTKDDEWARIALHSSIMDGDFGRYIIGTNSWNFAWSPDPLNGPPVPRARERLAAFLGRLTERQRRAHERIGEASREEVIAILERRTEAAPARNRDLRKRAERAFLRTLGKRKLAAYERDVQPYERSPNEEPRFDLRMAQRWVLQRVFALGWSVGRFGRFDRTESRRGDDRRQAGKVERMGKKYQWIAWHEFLALVADNFRFARHHGEDGHKYEGPWQLYRRDIDPSVLLRKSELERWRAHSRTWWFPVEFTNWLEPVDDELWRQATTDLPSVAPLLDVTRPDGTRALVLETYVQWAQQSSRDAEEELEERRIMYWLKSYLVRAEHLDAVVAWARGRNLHTHRFPEVHYPTEAFLGEFPWARAVISQAGTYHSRPGWSTGDDRAPIPHPVLATNDTYFWEQSGYDCSIDDTFEITLPCKELSEGLNLEWRGVEGKFFDADGQLIASDPAVTEAGPGALVIARESLLAFLARQGLAIFWVVFGERQVIAPGHRGMEYNELSGVYTLRDGLIDGALSTYSPHYAKPTPAFPIDIALPSGPDAT